MERRGGDGVCSTATGVPITFDHNLGPGADTIQKAGEIAGCVGLRDVEGCHT